MVAQSAIQPPPCRPDTPKPQPTRINAKLTGHEPHHTHRNYGHVIGQNPDLHSNNNNQPKRFPSTHTAHPLGTGPAPDGTTTTTMGPLTDYRVGF